MPFNLGNFLRNIPFINRFIPPANPAPNRVIIPKGTSIAGKAPTSLTPSGTVTLSQTPPRTGTLGAATKGSAPLGPFRLNAPGGPIGPPGLNQPGGPIGPPGPPAGYQPSSISGGSTQISPEEKAAELLQKGTDIISEFANQFDVGQFPGIVDFDVALAKKLAEEGIAPFYAQTLQTFLRGQQLAKQRAGGTTGNVLQQLLEQTQAGQQKAQRLQELGLQELGGQFEERGLFESGARRREQGLLEATGQQELQRFLRGQELERQTQEQKLADFLEQLSLQRVEEERGLARGQETDIASAIEQARQSALSGARELEVSGLQPGETPESFAQRRENVYKRFLFPGVS